MKTAVVFVVALLLLAACVPIPAAPTVATEPPPAAETAAPATVQSVAAEGALHLGWVWPEEELLVWPGLAVGRDGLIYVADQEGALHAVAAPGQESWSVTSECGLALPPILSADEDALYFAAVTEDDTLSVCAVTLDGEPLWAADPEGVVDYVPTLGADGLAYLRSDTGVVRITPDGEATQHALPEEATGSVIRTGAPLAVDGAGNSYYVNTLNSKIVVVSPEFATRAECPVGRGPAGVIGALGGDKDESSAEGESPTIVNMWVADPVARAGEGFVVAADPGVVAAYDADCNEL